MSCGCTNNKRLDDNRKISLESMKDLSIDNIINLYRQGYALQGTDDHMNQDNIKSLSPCIIQQALFQKNGSTSVPGCTATITDKVDVDIIVTFSAADNGIPVWYKAIVQTPDGASREFNSSTFNMVTGTQDLIVNIPISIYGIGIYKIIAVHIADNYSGAYRCSVYNTGASCQSITVTGVTPPPFTTIIISQTTAPIQVGQTRQLMAACKNSIGNVIACPSLLWISNNPYVATVTQTGLVTGVIEGTAYITANYSGITSNYSTIIVTAPVLTSITISPATASIQTADTRQLTAVCNITCPTLTWASSDPTKATVSATGLVTGVSSGTASITASVLGITSNVSVITVTAPVLTSITISPATASIQTTTTQQLTTVCKDQNTNVMTCPTLAWASSDPAKATVSTTGLVTGVSPGTASITASAAGKTSNVSVITVTAPTPVLTTITISPPSVTLYPGGIQVLTAVCNITCPTLAWASSDPAKATVSTTGLVTGVSPGTASITASAAGKTSNVSVITVTTTTPTLSTITVSPSTASVAPGNTKTFVATPKDQFGGVMTGITVTWSVIDATKGTVSPTTGLSTTFTGVAEGTTTIKAMSGIVVGTASVTVTTTPAAGEGGAIVIAVAALIAAAIFMARKSPSSPPLPPT